MLTIQTGFKTDLESNRSIFVIYVSNGEQTFNCAIDYDIIKKSKSAQQIFNSIAPALQQLLKACYPDKIEDKKEKQETKAEGETFQ